MNARAVFEVVCWAAPSVVIAWVTDWLDLFRHTLIIRPTAGEEVSSTSSAISVLLVIFFAYFSRDWNKKRDSQWAKHLMAAALCLMFLCFSVRFVLSYPHTMQVIEFLKFFWDLSFIAFVVSALLALMFTVKSKLRRELRRLGLFDVDTTLQADAPRRL